jgi:hypothetical protein
MASSERTFAPSPINPFWKRPRTIPLRSTSKSCGTSKNVMALSLKCSRQVLEDCRTRAPVLMWGPYLGRRYSRAPSCHRISHGRHQAFLQRLV